MYTKGEIIRLNTFKWGYKWPVERVKQVALGQLANFPRRMRISIEQLLPHDRYEAMEGGEKSHVGRCISLLVSREDLPLIRIKGVGASKRYLTI